jgi:hypothetical protein
VTFNLPWGKQRIVDPAERPVTGFRIETKTIPVGVVPGTVEHTTCKCKDKTPQALETRRVVPCCERDTDADGNCDRHPGGIYEVILP